MYNPFFAQNGGNLAAMFGGFGGGGGDALLPAAPANHDNAGLGVIDQDAGQDIMEGEEGNNEENEVAVNDANNEGAQGKPWMLFDAGPAS